MEIFATYGGEGVNTYCYFIFTGKCVYNSDIEIPASFYVIINLRLHVVNYYLFAAYEIVCLLLSGS